VALKKRFVDADLLDADYAYLRDQLDDAIDQKKRVAMRQEFLNCLGIEDCFHSVRP
jgi:5-bromo-4-chloroindolyl phosphate hydrolysis protein